MNASTVGRRLTAIEDSLGARLFDRVDGRLLATTAGAMVVRHAQTIEEECVSLEHEVRGVDARPRGEVTIAGLDALMNHFVIPSLPSLAQLYPEIVVNIYSAFDFADLVRFEADIAIRDARPSHPDLVGRRLGTHSGSAYQKRGLQWSGPAPVIAPPPRRGESLFVECLRRIFPELRIVARANSEGHFHELVRAGVGVTVLECVVGDADPELERVFPDLLLEEELWLTTHVARRRSARIRAVVDFLAAEYSASESFFRGSVRSGGVSTLTPA